MGREPGQPTIYVFECLIGFQEKISREVDIRKLLVSDLQIDNHKLSARDLIFCVHFPSLGARPREPALQPGQKVSADFCLVGFVEYFVACAVIDDDFNITGPLTEVGVR